VPDLFPGPVLASLRADPDRPAFEIGPRTVSRVVVAPAVGRFYPDRTRRSGSRLRDKDPVWAGIGQVDSQRVSTPVCSHYLRHRIDHTGQRSKD
jgi:hypothetical protein